MQAAAPKQSRLVKEFLKGRSLQFRNRELILRASEEPQGVYYIESGLVKVYSISDQGEENIHIIYRPGEIFPLSWIFTGLYRNVFYESLGPSRVYRLLKEKFLELIKDSDEMSFDLLMMFALQFSVFTDRLENLQYTDAQAKVVYRLLFLGGRFGQRKNGKLVIEAPITHHHIANSVNLARETVSREIEKLDQAGLISLQKRRVVLEDIEGLKKIIGETVSPNLWGLK